MKFIYSTLLLASAAFCVNCMPGNSYVQSPVQSALAMYALQPAAFDGENASPELSVECFSLYLPMLNEVGATFSTNYQACITIANNKTAQLAAAAAKSQTLYKQEATKICSAFTVCDNQTDVVGFFNCYADASQNDISLVYDMSTNAASSASTFTEGLQAIQDTQYQCTNQTENIYVRDTAATYDLLNSCLKNGVPSTTAAPTSSSSTSSASMSSSASTSSSPAAAETTESATTVSDSVPAVSASESDSTDDDESTTEKPATSNAA